MEKLEFVEHLSRLGIGTTFVITADHEILSRSRLSHFASHATWRRLVPILPLPLWKEGHLIRKMEHAFTKSSPWVSCTKHFVATLSKTALLRNMTSTSWGMTSNNTGWSWCDQTSTKSDRPLHGVHGDKFVVQHWKTYCNLPTAFYGS